MIDLQDTDLVADRGMSDCTRETSVAGYSLEGAKPVERRQARSRYMRNAHIMIEICSFMQIEVSM